MLWLTDDNFFADRAWAVSVLRAIIDSGIRCAFTVQARFEVGFDDEMLELLKAEGVNVVEVPDKTEWQNKVADVIAKYSAGMEDIVERISAQ